MHYNGPVGLTGDPAGGGTARTKATPRAAWALLFASLLGASVNHVASMRQKLDLVESGGLKPRASLVFTSNEVNAYAQHEIQKEVGDAMRNLRIQFGTNRAEGSCTVDFDKLQTAKGRPGGLMAAMLLRGSHELGVRARSKSGGGTAQVDIEEASIDGFVIRGKMLDLLVDYYLKPRVPDVKIGQPFELRHGVERFEVAPEGVTVHAGATPPAGTIPNGAPNGSGPNGPAPNGTLKK